MSNVKQIDEKMAEYDNVPSMGIVGEIKIEFGFHCYIEGNDFWKFYRGFNKPEDTQAAFLSAKDAVENAGGDARQLRPGVCVKIYADVLSRDTPYAADLREFTPRWQEGAYSMILDAIGSLPIGEKFYGQVQYKANPYHVAKGEAGKTSEDREGNPAYPTIRVPVQKFTKQEAIDFVAANSNTSNVSTISDAAQSNAQEILDNWAIAQQGNCPFPDTPEYTKSFPLMPEKMTPPERKGYENQVVQWLAKVWEVTASDIDQLIAQEISF